MLGLAFHPQFASNNRFFVNYTRQTDGATVAQYTASASAAVTATTERIFLVIAQPFANHNGGMVEFGLTAISTSGWVTAVARTIPEDVRRMLGSWKRPYYQRQRQPAFSATGR